MGNPNEVPESSETEKEPHALGFSWLVINNEHYKNEGINLTPDPDKLHGYVIFRQPLPEELSEAEKAGLQNYTSEDGTEYAYSGFGRFDLEVACRMERNRHPSLTAQSVRQHKDEIVKPLEISEAEVAAVIKNGKAIIYTGAGISVAAGTPDMKALTAYLGIDRSKNVDDFTRAMIFNPETIKERLLQLQATFFENTTPAHKALAEVQQLTGVEVATENLDQLGKTAGITEIRREQIESQFPDERLQSLDCIITVGLHGDDSGLLYRFRQANPDGRFIALNVEQPPYLEKQDYYLEGDAQVTLPKIAELIRSAENVISG